MIQLFSDSKNVILIRNIFIFSGHNSQRRFRSHTPFSTRTSYSGNTYSHFLEDDEEITGIIQDYVKYGRSVGWHQDKEHLEHGVVSSDHMPDVNNEGSVNVMLYKSVYCRLIKGYELAILTFIFLKFALLCFLSKTQSHGLF